MRPRPAPPTVVDDAGHFRFGTYTTPVFTPDFGPARVSDMHGFIGAPHRSGLGGWMRSMRLKEWHHVTLITEEYVITAAIVQLGYVGNAFCRVFERDTGTCLQFERLLPFGRDIVFGGSSVRGATSWREGGSHMTFEYQPQAGGLWSCTFNLPLGDEHLQGQVSVYPEAECLALVHRLGPNRAAYTHKEAGNRAEGLLTVGMREIRFEHDSQATVDWTRAFPNRHTRWNWLSAAGIAGDGRRLGLNLSEHVYDAAENALWLDGSMHLLGPVTFTPPATEGRPWVISSERCTLEFHPDGKVAQDVRRLLVRSSFTQHFGSLEGHLRLEGALLPINGLYGVCETHEATW